MHTGHEELVKWLLDHGADIQEKDLDGFDVINQACWGGNASIIRLLAERGANLTPYHEEDASAGLINWIWVSSKGHNEIALLLRHHEKKVKKGSRPSSSTASSNNESDELINDTENVRD